MDSVILGEKPGEKEESFQWRDHGDIIRKIGRDKSYITFLNREGKEVKISLLDLSSIGNLEHDYIIELLNELLGVSVTSPEGIAKINELAQKSYDYLKYNLLYTDKELKHIGSIEFSSSQDIVKFLQSTKKSNGLKKCMLAKVARAYVDGFSFDVEEKRQKTRQVLEDKVLENLRDISSKSSMSYEGYEEALEFMQKTGRASMKGSIFVEISDGNGRRIEFDLELREKTVESTISKSIREKDYVNQGKIMDLLGIRVLCDNRDDTLLVMNFLSQIAFKYGEYRVKNKGGITPENLEQSSLDCNESTKGFFKVLEESFRSVEKRANTASGYKDIKIVPKGKGNKLSFEIIFLEYDSSNNDGLAHHICFEYKRKIAERIRLEGFITKQGIKVISDALICKISSGKITDLNGKKPTELLREVLVDIIIETEGKISPQHGFDNRKTKSIFSDKNDISLINRKQLIVESLKGRKKQELEQELKGVLPSFYLAGLIPFCDTNGNRSEKRKKYTNSLGLENMSVLGKDGKYKRLA